MLMYFYSLLFNFCYFAVIEIVKFTDFRIPYIHIQLLEINFYNFTQNFKIRGKDFNTFYEIVIIFHFI